MSPYRELHGFAARSDADDWCPDADVLPALGVVWTLSVLRVLAGLARHEAAGPEATFALLCVVLVPLLCRDALAWSWRRARRWWASRRGPVKSARGRELLISLLCSAAAALAREADAQEAPATEQEHVALTPVAYVEAYYAYNLNRPSNDITNFRGFDNRHDSFTLSNVAAGANLESGPVGARFVFQVGSTPSTYYLAEPAVAGTASVNATGSDLWKYLQEAYVTYRAPVGRGLLFQLGLCASPIGFEVFAVKDNWNWSRSNLFYALPFYHTGLRATYEWSERISTTVSVFNGWNSVVDDNEEKSVEANVTYRPDDLLLQALYFGGVERRKGAPEGPYWRHHFDALGQVDPTTWLSFAAQADYGWEPNRFGTAHWYGGALYGRVKPVDRLYVAVRGDRLHEDTAFGSAGSSSPLFLGGVDWVTSFTGTIDVRPHDHLSVRFEYRHDVAEAPLFFGRDVAGDGSAASPFVANARTQDTLLAGATAWF